MSSNQDLLQKADMTLADLSGGTKGGLLPPEEGATFIRKLIDQPVIMRVSRVVEMNAPQRKINKIGFGSRILRKAVSATALTEAQRSKPTTEQIELNTKEVIAEVRLPYDVVEDNIERATAATNSPSNQAQMGGLKDTLITLIAERAALDMEELAILGDTAYTNAGDQDDEDYLSLVDGYLKLANDNGNVLDVANATISRQMFRDAVKTMPDKYLRNKASMRHFISFDNETHYRDMVADRQTGYGDATVQGTSELRAFGSAITPVALMPDEKGLYCNPLNLLFGIQRQVSMEYDKDITARVYIIVLTARIDVQIEEAEAVVTYQNIAAA